jgi:predicted acylesterase/phospholipase RssA
VETELFLDEFRPFRRGELALARRLLADPVFMGPREADLIRYALRLAQLSAVGPRHDALVYPIGSFRLRLLQLLAPALPTDPARIDARDLYELLPRIVLLVDDARDYITSQGASSELELDAEISHKQLTVVLGGAAGSGYIFLGALERLERIGITPAYLVGCSIGAILAVVRARQLRMDLQQLRVEIQRLRGEGIFRVPNPTTRYGVPAALRLDLRRTLGKLFAHPDGSQVRLRELAIPTDIMTAGLGPGALGGSKEDFAHLIDVNDADQLRHLRAGAVARLGARLVSLAMSRRVLVPLLFGAAPGTGDLAALDAAGFSAAIPGVLHYDLDPRDPGAAILDALFKEHNLVGLIDGSLASVLPASHAFGQIESDRLPSRHSAILALDAVTRAGGTNALLAPLLRAINPSVQRDKAFWDVHVAFRRAPPLLDLFPPDARLESAVRQGELEFESSAQLLKVLLAPVAPWSELRAAVET